MRFSNCAEFSIFGGDVTTATMIGLACGTAILYVLRANQSFSIRSAVLLTATACFSASSLLLALTAALFFTAACFDAADGEVYDDVLIPAVYLALTCGIRHGNYISAAISLVLIILFDVRWGDSDLIGGADVLLILAYLGFFGPATWAIFLVLGSAAGLLYKGIDLLSGRSRGDEQGGIRFLPWLFIGAAAACFIDMRFGSSYHMSKDDLIWVIRTLVWNH